MPLYTYECTGCKAQEEHLVRLGDRDKEEFLCSACGEPMRRLMDAPVIGKPGYQMQAVLESGKHVPGHFGKAAKKVKKK